MQMRPEPIHDPADLEEIFALRVAAWRARTDYFPEIERWVDSEDAKAAHWAIRDRGRIVAAARLTIHDSLADVPNDEIFRDVLPPSLDGPIASLNRLVVAASHSGQGHSASLGRVRIDHARLEGCRHVIGETYAGMKRIAQLGDLGFKVVGTARPYGSGPLAAVKAARNLSVERADRVATIVHLRLAAAE